MLAVIQPDIPGRPHLSLPFTRDELARIEKRVQDEYLVKLGISGSPTSMEKVLSHLPDASVVHFACHGTQDHTRPLESALLLADGGLKISTIMKSPLPNARLAFLSACETAKGDDNVPDEAIHIAATMLFAGFQGVVGTMWCVFCFFLEDIR